MSPPEIQASPLLLVRLKADGAFDEVLARNDGSPRGRWFLHGERMAPNLYWLGLDLEDPPAGERVCVHPTAEGGRLRLPYSLESLADDVGQSVVRPGRGGTIDYGDISVTPATAGDDELDALYLRRGDVTAVIRRPDDGALLRVSDRANRMVVVVTFHAAGDNLVLRHQLKPMPHLVRHEDLSERQRQAGQFATRCRDCSALQSGVYALIPDTIRCPLCDSFDVSVEDPPAGFVEMTDDDWRKL